MRLESDFASYVAGDTAAFTLTVINNGNKNIGAGEITATPAVPDATLSSVIADQLAAQTLGKVNKNGGVATVVFSITIPEDLLSTDTDFEAAVSYVDGKTPVDAQVSLPFEISAAHKGLACMSATDAGTRLSGFAATYDEDVLAVRYGLVNYDAATTSYTFELNVTGHMVPNDGGEDITSALSAQWGPALPGAPADAMSGSGSLAGNSPGTGEVSVALDPKGDPGAFNAYSVTLTVTDGNGNTTSRTIDLLRDRLDLSNITWVIRDDTNGNGKITQKGTDWFNDLYYDKVAADSRVPFKDAASFCAYLASAPTEEEAQMRLNRFIWDMYEPHKGIAGDYGDANIQWPKDSLSPFHHQLQSTVERMGTYTQSEAGVTHDDDYFSNLVKTAGPDLGDDNEDRTYTIDLHAETDPVATQPAVYVFMIPNPWQMFDELHAITQSGGNTAKGSILTAVDEMAYLYDIKKALIRFTDYLESQGSNAAIAITNTQHVKNAYSIVSSGGYFTTDMDGMADALAGWDVFGECEHVHWTTESLKNAINGLPTELSTWEDAEGVPINLDNVTKTVIAIGGPTENIDSDHGYKAPLDDGNTNWNNIDYLYGIRTDTGTTEVALNGRPLYSWLDRTDNQDLIKAHNPYYTSYNDPDNPAYSICTSEDALYNQFVSIYERSSHITGTTTFGVVDDVVLSDTVTDEFQVTGVTATWTSVDGTTVTSTWTPQGGTAVGKGDPNPDEITVTVHGDGTTGVSCDFGRLTGTGAADVRIDVRAKEDYLGSNNVLTNEGTPSINWSHTNTQTQATRDFRADFTQEPSANVPLLPMSATGRSNSGRVGTTFDLADHATFDSFDLFNGAYDQLNGTLTISWVEIDTDGNEVTIPDDPSYASSTYTVVDGMISGSFKLPSCSVVSDVEATRNFRLKVEYQPEDATNGMIPVSGRTVNADVTLSWINELALSILKVDADDKTPLPGVGFALYADDGDGKFDAGKDPSADVFKDAALTEKLTGDIITDASGKAAFFGLKPGTYWIQETSTVAGYHILDGALRLRIADDGRAYLTQTGGQEAEVTVEDEILAKITIENRKIPPPCPYPVPQGSRCSSSSGPPCWPCLRFSG
ncbi:prealbumin-like fold domain-containing protein [Curtanaerobium respiraculi]|uniref:prealbumin-like fold domain-containing protein n=1 Tax=Curtanaerobium respiraculi TaxID=2949669 RepID=UPI0024B35D10|nr:prealbumin-like fold domain-containing protein [Curtanaerobium respiraculi]